MICCCSKSSNILIGPTNPYMIWLLPTSPVLEHIPPFLLDQLSIAVKQITPRFHALQQLTVISHSFLHISAGELWLGILVRLQSSCHLKAGLELEDLLQCSWLIYLARACSLLVEGLGSSLHGPLHRTMLSVSMTWQLTFSETGRSKKGHGTNHNVFLTWPSSSHTTIFKIS